MISSKSACSGFQPSTVLAFSLEATNLAGSPALLSATLAAIGSPVAFFAVDEDKLPDGHLLFFTKDGLIKKTEWSEYNLLKPYYQARSRMYSKTDS